MKTLIGTFTTFGSRLRLRPGWLRPQPAPAIRVFDACFAVRDMVVPWDAVSRIRAWRLAPGPIRLDVRADVEEGIITLAEGQRGFDDFVAMADRKMIFPLGWWDHLDSPATRRQGVTLFERFTHG
jgi:hypothetical protein